MAAIWFDTDDDATELVKALHAEGYRTELAREGFAGEDDSEDRAWLLSVEPFDDRVVDMVDVYGGWMPGDEQLPADSGSAESPPELPGGPRRSNQS